MIPVSKQPEPPGFDQDVRQEGHAWLQKKGIVLNAPPPKPSELPTFWRQYNKPLWDAYGGVCAYLAFRFQFVSGASSTDHFIANPSLLATPTNGITIDLPASEPIGKKTSSTMCLILLHYRKILFSLIC